MNTFFIVFLIISLIIGVYFHNQDQKKHTELLKSLDNKYEECFKDIKELATKYSKSGIKNPQKKATEEMLLFYEPEINKILEKIKEC